MRAFDPYVDSALRTALLVVAVRLVSFLGQTAIEELKKSEGTKAGLEVLFLCTLGSSVWRVEEVFRSLTFWEKPTHVVGQVSSQVPAISKVVISFNQFYTISFEQCQFIRTAG